MTTDHALAAIQQLHRHRLEQIETVPDELIIALCDALWDEGHRPQLKLLLAYLPNLHERALTRGFHAWRTARGLHLHYPRWANPHVGGTPALVRMLSPEIASAPLTALDPNNDGRWQPPHPKSVVYLASLSNQSVRDVLALFALIKCSLGDHPLYCRLAGYAAPLQKLMQEQGIANIQDIDPDDLLLKVCENKAGAALSPAQRLTIVLGWNNLTNALEQYAERLDDSQRERMARFFLRPLRKRYRMHRSRPSVILRDTSREKVKAKTDIVHSQFHKLRFMARIRCNQARRLHEATCAAAAAIRAGTANTPYHFSYEETVATETAKPVRQRVLLTLWDSSSLWDHACEKGHTSGAGRLRQKQIGRFSPASRRFIVQYRGTEAGAGCPVTAPFWFLEIYENQVFSHRKTTDTMTRQKGFFLKHGYSSQMYWEQTPGLLKPLRKHVGSDVTFLERERGYRFLHTEGIYATCLFAHMVVRMQTITGARIGEVQQVSQNPDCIKELAGIGPKATTRWLLRMIPKGRQERGDYFIDSDTKDVLAEVVRFHRQMLGVKKLPVVNHQSSKYARDRYLLQWNGLPLDQSTLNTALRFLLHGAVIDSGGVGVHLTSHVLRHGFATEMASLKVPVEVIAQILHQRHVEVTRYYSRPTKQQVMQAAELLFVDRIDMAAEALRSPDEIAQMLRKAEGQIGALTEVLGGTCVVSNMCPAKFACVGCSGNAPDPERRYQIEKKRSWALQQISWANREGLPAEERQMKQLVQDCDLMLDEMVLIERARSDSRQQVVVRKDAKHATS